MVRTCGRFRTTRLRRSWVLSGYAPSAADVAGAVVFCTSQEPSHPLRRALPGGHAVSRRALGSVGVRSPTGDSAAGSHARSDGRKSRSPTGHNFGVV